MTCPSSRTQSDPGERNSHLLSLLPPRDWEGTAPLSPASPVRVGLPVCIIGCRSREAAEGSGRRIPATGPWSIRAIPFSTALPPGPDRFLVSIVPTGESPWGETIAPYHGRLPCAPQAQPPALPCTGGLDSWRSAENPDTNTTDGGTAVRMRAEHDPAACRGTTRVAR